MKAMQQMHDQMMNAKTPAQRQALMVDHMKSMQGGMATMKGMGCMGPMGGASGMGGDMAKAGNVIVLFMPVVLLTLIMAFMFLFLRTMASDENERFEGKITVYSSMLPRLFASPMYNLDDRMVDYLVRKGDYRQAETVELALHLKMCQEHM